MNSWTHFLCVFCFCFFFLFWWIDGILYWLKWNMQTTLKNILWDKLSRVPGKQSPLELGNNDSQLKGVAQRLKKKKKKLPASAGDEADIGSIPGSGRSPGGRNSNLLQDSCLENSMDRAARRATVHGVVKSQTRLSDWACMHAFMITTISHGRFVIILFYREENENLDWISRQNISRSGHTSVSWEPLSAWLC